MAKQIIFRIKDGQVQMEGKGFTGGECEKAIQEYEDLLGGKVTGRKRKPEYHRKADVRKTVDQSG